MDFIQGHVRDVMTLLFFSPIRSNVTYSRKSGILGMYESTREIVNATFVHFLAALLLAPEEHERHDVTNMTLMKSIRRGRERMRDRQRPGPSENQATKRRMHDS